MEDLTRRSLLAAGGTLGAAAAMAPVGALADAKGSLAGRSFLITGSSTGFGRLGALLYARAGAKVFATMRGLPRPEATELEGIARAEKLDLHVLPLDVRSDEQVAAAVREAETRNGGPLDVLVNNAGVVINGPVEVHDMEAFHLAFDTNVYGFHRMARAVLPGMRARKSGLIVNVSSQQGRFVMPGSGVYAPTKFAVEAWAEQLAYEVQPHGIEVAIIQPGGFLTNVGVNRARYAQAVKDRADPERLAAYPALAAQMGGTPRAGGGTVPPGMPDPVMVPQAIAEIAAMPAGSRPLRRAVHPGAKPQLEINRVSAETQRQVMGSGPYAQWAAAVLD